MLIWANNLFKKLDHLCSLSTLSQREISSKHRRSYADELIEHNSTSSALGAKLY